VFGSKCNARRGRLTGATCVIAPTEKCTAHACIVSRHTVEETELRIDSEIIIIVVETEIIIIVVETELRIVRLL
jgi:hypothetical protein